MFCTVCRAVSTVFVVLFLKSTKKKSEVNMAKCQGLIELKVEILFIQTRKWVRNQD